MDEWNAKLTAWADTPLGSILVFTLVYLVRIVIATQAEKLRKRTARKRKAA